MAVNLKSCLSYLAAVFKPKAQNSPSESNAPAPRLIELAQQGQVDAQAALGEYYFDIATEEGRALSLKWNREAANKGDPAAQCRLGTILHEGDGVERNPEEAFRWWTAAAKQGHAGAWGMMGGYIELGLGNVQRSEVEALYCYSVSSALGNELGAIMFESLRKKLSPAQIEEAKALMRRRHPGLAD
jgi:TPR repeat protein